jgi:hypothetical protein
MRARERRGRRRALTTCCGRRFFDRSHDAAARGPAGVGHVVGESDVGEGGNGEEGGRPSHKRPEATATAEATTERFQAATATARISVCDGTRRRADAARWPLHGQVTDVHAKKTPCQC